MTKEDSIIAERLKSWVDAGDLSEKSYDYLYKILNDEISVKEVINDIRTKHGDHSELERDLIVKELCGMYKDGYTDGYKEGYSKGLKDTISSLKA